MEYIALCDKKLKIEKNRKIFLGRWYRCRSPARPSATSWSARPRTRCGTSRPAPPTSCSSTPCSRTRSHRWYFCFKYFCTGTINILLQAHLSTNFTTKPNAPGRFIVWFRNETTLLVLWQPPFPPGHYTDYKVRRYPRRYLRMIIYNIYPGLDLARGRGAERDLRAEGCGPPRHPRPGQPSHISNLKQHLLVLSMSAYFVS